MYLTLKLLHIAAVIVFLGNIVTGRFWHAHALRTRDPRVLAHTMEGVIRSDRLFTTPGVIGILVAGLLLTFQADWSLLRTGWILWTIVLFLASGAIFGIRVAPLQRQLLALAQQGAGGGFDFECYRALARQWDVWGLLAIATPVAGLALMVLKPAL
jgi:uncharacterized membrane protein